MRSAISAVAVGVMMLGVAVSGVTGAVKTNSQAPDFTLKDTNGNNVKLSSYKGKYVVLEWINHGCPFVKKHYDSGNFQAMQKELAEQDVVWLSICSSAKGKQGYMEPAKWNKTIEEKGSAAKAVLLDTNGRVGKLYAAKTTPHMYVINPEGVLIYQGAIDDKATANVDDVPEAVNYVRIALMEAKEGKPVETPMTEAYGCSVKYR